MSDDAVLLQGRQTKRKWKLILALLLLALVFLAGAWAAAHPQTILAEIQEFTARIRSGNVRQWIATDHGPATCAFLADDHVFFVEAGSISALELDGRTAYRETTALQAPQAVYSSGAAAVFDPGGCTLFLINGTRIQTLDIPLGIDAAAVSDSGNVAVITADSGYSTVTCCFDPQGVLLREVKLRDEAMVLMTYLLGQETLAACIITADGTWLLRYYNEDTCIEIPLESSEVYEIKPCGSGVALWTCEGICLISGTGEHCGTLNIAPEELLLWDSNSFAAAVVLEEGSPVLVTIDEMGTVSRSQPLGRTPRNLSVCASRLCVLDRESLLIYDRHCLLKDSTSEGAYAASAQAIPGGVALYGDCEFMRYLSK